MLNDQVSIKKSSQMLKAMGNVCRMQIIIALLEGEKNVSQLNQHIKVSQPALSQHLSKLRREGILGARREQRQIYYYISNPQVPPLVEMLERVISHVGDARKRA